MDIGISVGLGGHSVHTAVLRFRNNADREFNLRSPECLSKLLVLRTLTLTFDSNHIRQVQRGSIRADHCLLCPRHDLLQAHRSLNAEAYPRS